MSEFTDGSPTTLGTPIDAATLDPLVLAQGSIVSGGLPASISGLVITMPATQAIYASGGADTFVPANGTTVASTTVTIPATPSGVWYVDLTTAGAYVATQSGTVSANAVRLYSVSSNGTTLSATTQIAPSAPVSEDMVSADLTEAATNDTLTAGSTLRNQLNRLRYQVGQVVGGAWTAAVAMIPLSQKGAASGVAALDATSRVVATGGVVFGAAASLLIPPVSYAGGGTKSMGAETVALVDTTAGVTSFYLPAITSGRVVHIHWIAGSNSLNVQPQSGNDFEGGVTTLFPGSAGASYTFVGSGTRWYRIAAT